MRKLFLIVFLAFLSAPLRAAGTLDVYFIDVEGGQSTLFVSPSGESMLVDTGWPGFNGRDAERISNVAKAAGVTRINYLVITHFHRDHVGGVPQLAERIPIGTYVDHGRSVETGKDADELYHAYVQARDRASHLIVRAGDKIPIEGISVRVVASTGQGILRPLLGGGEPNPFCASTKPRAVDPSENAQSIGMLITFGKFRMIDLGDLTWNKELGLVCPDNKLGTVDVYLSTHHGLDQSNAPAIVHALKPRVAITNNGATKGGSPEALQTIRTSPGIEDVWQLHYAQNAGKENNAPEPFIVNVDQDASVSWIKLSADSDGGFTVTNSRNGKTKAYAPR
ncbi:MAG: MBL fold metallo-hydrolase [Terriglobia bacterium]|jgi:beta-lactamase superfamily II metal-dependent hydrolase